MSDHFSYRAKGMADLRLRRGYFGHKEMTGIRESGNG